jgi:hypothetical protein
MSLRFRKHLIDKGAYEAASVCDINGDGILDIVCGAYWYEGPDFKKKYKMCDVAPEGEYYDDFCDFPMDVNGDGRPDIITGGWFGGTLRWRENPGNYGKWKVHDIDACGCIETIRFFDIDGCGCPEIFPNTPLGPQAYYKLIKNSEGKGSGQFKKVVISEGSSDHGMGFADINGDGRVDIILRNGWLEQPEDPENTPWKFHPDFKFASASVPILGLDITGNGLTDIIVGHAHGYGLWWYEQVLTQDGKRTFIEHPIDLESAQYHDMMLIDIDGDGELELVTGKRYRAHCGNDPGDNDPVFICYFKIDGGRFEKHVIDYGPAGEASGVGIYFWMEDLTGNGYPDIIAPGKEGLFLFENLGPEL